MTAEAAIEHRLEPPRRTPRQDDGVIYKAMAFVIFAIFGLPVGYGLSRGMPAGSWLLLVPAEIFAFGAIWDFALLATGRRDMLLVDKPRFILGRALRQGAQAGFACLFIQLPQELIWIGFGLFLAWTISGWLIE